MKFLAVIFAVIFAFFAGLVITTFFLPTATSVERRIEIDAPEGVVFHLVSNHRELMRWSPLKKLDPEMLVVYTGPESGLGSAMVWSGNENVGEGEAVFVELVPNQKAVTQLKFGEQGEGLAFYLIENVNGMTWVTWRYSAEHKNLLQRWVGLFYDGLIGPSYEAGLADLKVLAESHSGIASREISYRHRGERFQGYLAYPVGMRDPVPGVLVVHEWWGHNEYARQRADQLAMMGYAAFALDMFGDGKQADHPDQAMSFMRAVGASSELAEKRFDKAMEILAEHAVTDERKIAAIGYCYGGSVVLNMAKRGKNLLGVASFHGGLGDLAPFAEHAFTPVLVFNGGADPLVPQAHIDAFKKEFEALSHPFEFINYSEAKHAFTNPSADHLGERFELPLAFDEKANRDSWEKLEHFLSNVFY